MKSYIELLGYRFWTVSSERDRIGGVYLLVHASNDRSELLYVGETHNLRERFADHERLNDAIEAGANRLFFIECISPQARLDLETLIRRFCNPMVNRQSRPSLVRALDAAARLDREDICQQMRSEFAQEIAARLRFAARRRVGNAFASY